jgi:hypothetical protein
VNTCFLIFIYGCLPLIQNWNLQQMSFNIIRGRKTVFLLNTEGQIFPVTHILDHLLWELWWAQHVQFNIQDTFTPSLITSYGSYCHSHWYKTVG